MIIPIGATVRITKKGYWAYNKRVRVSGLPTIEIGGLDLGELVAFEAVNYLGEIDEHVIGRDWCEQIAAAVVPMLRARDGRPAEAPTAVELPLFAAAE